jgi:signal transduction histidine kinase
MMNEPLRDHSDTRGAAEDDLRQLAEEQSALRRVATLVAQGAPPEDVFVAVAKEVGQILGVTLVSTLRYEADGTATQVASWGSTRNPFVIGARLTPESPSVMARVLQTGRPARIEDFEDVPGSLAEAAREAGMRSAAGVPIIVNGKTWGAMIALTNERLDSSGHLESRLAEFTELMTAVIANTQAHDENARLQRERVQLLEESRARVVEAHDAERTRLERNLHDGAQQRLISVGLDLQALRTIVPQTDEVVAQLDRLQNEIDSILDEVREISRGLHPSLLSNAGLGPAVRALARRSQMPVELDLRLDGRLAQPAEIAAYYVVSEALANAAKHSRATVVRIRVAALEDTLRVDISDDGIGGANLDSGSGLIGLVDRVEASGGRFSIESAPGAGTTIAIELPLAESSRSGDAPIRSDRLRRAEQ